jgi:hypothetical protein
MDKIKGLSWFQATACENAALLDPAAFGKIGKSVAEVADVDAAIKAVGDDKLRYAKLQRAAGHRAASPGHSSVLRKLRALKVTA